MGLIPKDAGTGQLHIFFVIRFEADHDLVCQQIDGFFRGILPFAPQIDERALQDQIRRFQRRKHILHVLPQGQPQIRLYRFCQPKGHGLRVGVVQIHRLLGSPQDGVGVFCAQRLRELVADELADPFLRFLQPLPAGEQILLGGLVDLAVHLLLTDSGALFADSVDPVLDLGHGSAIPVAEPPVLPRRVHHQLGLHIAAGEDVQIEGFRRQQDVQGGGHAVANVVRVIDETCDEELAILQKQGLLAFRVGDFDPVPNLPSHLLGQVLLHGAGSRFMRQLSFHDHGAVDALGVGGGDHALAAGPAARLGLGHDDAFHILHALYPPQNVHILRGQKTGGNDLDIAEMDVVVETSAVFTDSRRAVIHTEEHGHP